MANAAHGFQIVPYPETPLEMVYEEQLFWRGWNSKYTHDLWWAFYAMFLILVLAIALVVAHGMAAPNAGSVGAEIVSRHNASPPVPPPAPSVGIAILNSVLENSAFLTAVLTIVAAGVAALYQLGKQRFSAVDVFSSEIAARMRILAASNIVDRIAASADETVHSRSSSGADRSNTTDPDVEPSEESQFETFHQLSSHLGGLTSRSVDHLTAFYSFHKAARDEMRALSRWRDHTASPARLAKETNVVFMLDLMAFYGMKALDDLIETRVHRLHCRQVCLCVGTNTNAFLVKAMLPTDHRLPEVKRRGDEYGLLIQGLRKELKRYRLVRKGKDFF